MSNCGCLKYVIKCVSLLLSCLNKLSDCMCSKDAKNAKSNKSNKYNDLEKNNEMKTKKFVVEVERFNGIKYANTDAGADADADEIKEFVDNFIHNILEKVIDDISKKQESSNYEEQNVKISMQSVEESSEDWGEDDHNYRVGYDTEEACCDGDDDSIQANWKDAVKSDAVSENTNQENVSDDGDLAIIDWADKSDDGLVTVDISYINTHNKSKMQRRNNDNVNEKLEFDNLYKPRPIKQKLPLSYLDAELEKYSKKEYPELDENMREFVKRDLEQTQSAWERHSTRNSNRAI